MADQPATAAARAADPGRDRRQQAGADRERRGAAAAAARADRRRPAVDQDADVHVQSRPCRRAVRDALVEAARRGVEVKLLIDGFGSAAPPDFFAALDQAGGEHCVFNPSYGRRYLMRNHQKLVVIDEDGAIIGGANIDDTLSERSRAGALARPVAAARRARRRRCRAAISTRLFRWSTRQEPVAQLRCGACSPNIANGAGRCSGSSAAP